MYASAKAVPNHANQHAADIIMLLASHLRAYSAGYGQVSPSVRAAKSASAATSLAEVPPHASKLWMMFDASCSIPERQHAHAKL